MKKILIAIPCMDQVAAGFCESLLTMRHVGDCIVSFVVGSLIYDSRNKLAAQALEHEADYILWIDSDMTFSPDALEKAVETIETYDCGMVSGLFFRRSAPYAPVLFSELRLEENGECHWKGYDNYPDKPFEVEGVGFGFVLMKTDIIFDIAAQEGPRWFYPEGNTGEDLAFCIRARDLGYKIMCNPDIKVGHIAHFVVNEKFYKSIHK